MIEIVPVESKDVAASPLPSAARAEGFRFIDRLIIEWTDGTNRFDAPGECFLGARANGKIVGVCGLNRDPHVNDRMVGRLRRLYVLPSHRRDGIASRLVLAALDQAGVTFRSVRLFTDQKAAGDFYLALGFRKENSPQQTHSILLE